MGIIYATIGFTIGLVLLLFPLPLAKFLRWRGGNNGHVASSGLMSWKKESGKLKIKAPISILDRFGEKKAIIIIRVVGIICIIASIFAFFSSQGM